MSSLTPIGAIARGAAAGIAGTAALDLVWFRRYRRGGGTDRLRDWELATGLDNWDDAPAPAIVGRRLTEGFLQQELPPSRAPLVTNVTHWAYGVAMGSIYGVLAGSRARVPTIRAGLGWGAVVCSSSYVTLPLAGVYQPIWKYDLPTLARDLSAHLAFGLGTAATFALLRPGD